MRFVIASSPFVGHLNPLLQVAGLLRGHGHEIIVHTATFLRDRAAGLDARFVPLLGNANFDSRDMAGVFPEHDHLTPGVEQFRYIMEQVFIDRMADQYAGLREIMRQTRVDGIIADYVFFGTMPLLLGAAPRRPAVIHFGFTCLYLERRDGAPPGPGILPAVDEVGRARCRAIRAEFDEAVVAPVQRHVDRRLAELGVGPLPMPVLDAIQAAARRVLSEPQFRIRTARFAEEFARYDTESEITRRVVEACDRNAVS